MPKVYQDDPQYAEKKNDIKEEINRMKNDKSHRYGGGLLDASIYQFDLEKNHILAKTQKLAQQQNKEEVVQRLAKAAESKSFISNFLAKENMQEAFSAAVWGAVATGIGVHFAIPAMAVCGTVLAVSCVAYGLVKKYGNDKVNKSFHILKNYARTGDLDASIKTVRESDKRLKKRIADKRNFMFNMRSKKRNAATK